MSAIPRGVRLNNPGNIRLGETKWQGQAFDQTDSEFISFTSPEYGIRAIAKILTTYYREGFDTIGQIVNRWAPPSENDTDSYVEAIAKSTGLNPNDVIDVQEEMPKLVKAIIHQENGEQPYTDAQIATGIGMV